MWLGLARQLTSQPAVAERASAGCLDVSAALQHQHATKLRRACGVFLVLRCKSETVEGLKAGSGWCPDGTPIENTVSSLVVLDLSDNGLVGE